MTAASVLSLSFAEGFGQPFICCDGAPCASVEKGNGRLAPQVRLLASSPLSGDDAKARLGACEAWMTAQIREHLRPLLALEAELAGQPAAGDEAPLSGLARGIAFQLAENLGVLARTKVVEALRAVDQEARRGLRRHRIRIGASNLFIPVLLKPAATRLRLMLWALSQGLDRLPEEPTPGMVWIDMAKRVPEDFYRIAGFHPAGTKAIRVDMIERLADAVRPLGERGTAFEVSPDVMGLVGLSGGDFVAVMKAIGYGARILPSPAKPKKAGPEEAKPEKDKPEAAEPAPDRTGDKASAAVPAPASAPDPAPTPRHLFHWSPEGPNKASPVKKQASHKADKKTGKKRHPKARPEKAPDPHSPFASLASLKRTLEKGRQ